MRTMNHVDYIIDYDELCMGTIDFDYGGSTTVHRSLYRTRETRGKSAILCDNEIVNLSYEMHNLYGVKHYNYAIKKIFVASDVKVPRELYRKNGYEIKRDPDDADVTILPYLEKRLPRFEYDVAVYEPERKRLSLLALPREDGKMLELSQAQIDAITTRFGGALVSADFGPHYAFMLPKCQEYFDLIQNTYPTRKYMFEDDFDLEDVPVTISPETLLLWEKIDSSNLLRKTILNSDWRDYPVTLCAFLRLNFRSINSCNDVAFKNVCRQIRYDSDMSVVDLVRGTTVEPKDWNMLQSYILKKMGVDGDKAFVSFDSYMNAKDLRRFLPRKIAVSALTISQPIATDNLLEMLGGDI